MYAYELNMINFSSVVMKNQINSDGHSPTISLEIVNEIIINNKLPKISNLR